MRDNRILRLICALACSSCFLFAKALKFFVYFQVKLDCSWIRHNTINVNTIGVKGRLIVCYNRGQKLLRLLFLFCFLIFIKEIRGGQPEISTDNMGYLNSVLSPSKQVYADDAPVSGGGLRWKLLISFQSTFRSRNVLVRPVCLLSSLLV